MTNQKGNQKETRFSKPSNKANLYLRYTGLAFELFAIIGIGVWGGYRLDLFFENKYPVLLITLTFIATGAAIYSLYRKLPKY